MQSEAYYMADALEDLLDKERAEILDGALQNMGRIAAEKQALMGKHELIAPDQKTLDRLHHKAARNQQLLSAAIYGVRSVAARLKQIRGGNSELTTYNKDGKSIFLGANHNGSLRHKV